MGRAGADGSVVSVLAVGTTSGRGSTADDAAAVLATILGTLLSGAYGFLLSAIAIANCTQRSDDPWSLSLIVDLPLSVATAA